MVEIRSGVACRGPEMHSVHDVPGAMTAASIKVRYVPMYLRTCYLIFHPEKTSLSRGKQRQIRSPTGGT